jgi:peptidoglycan hydrolase-like protein with peptidoglycan-binding domain
MQVLTGARRVSGLTAALVMLAGLTALTPPAPAASSPTAHGKHAATRPLTHLAEWSAGPVRRWTGYQPPAGSRRVREAQRRLNRLGYEPGPTDGRFGPLTERATRHFQMRNGLRADGVVGEATLSAMRRQSAHRRALVDWSAGPVGSGTGYQRRTGSVRVREVQWDLRRLHYATGPVDGLFGPRTEAAARRFQARHELPVNGVVTPSTLRALRALVAHPSAHRPATQPPSGTASPTPTPHPRPGPTGVTDLPPGLPVTLVVVGLVALGILTVAINYVRTRGRVTAAQQAVAHGAPPPAEVNRAAGSRVPHVGKRRMVPLREPVDRSGGPS